MSDLVKKVARAMVTSRDGWPDADAGGCKVWQMYETEARAAIKAVAEWIDTTGYTESEYWADVLKKRAANEQ